MRIRAIKPAFFKHEEMFDLEQSSKLPVRLAYIGLWCAADREGGHESFHHLGPEENEVTLSRSGIDGRLVVLSNNALCDGGPQGVKSK